MRIHRTLVLGASMALVFGSAAVGEAQSALPSGPVGDPVVKMGSADFNESAILGEIWGQALEADRGPRGTPPAHRPQGGDLGSDADRPDINAMPEYIGFLLETINENAGESSADSVATRQALASRFEPFDISVLGATEGGDVNAFVVTADTAQQYSLTTLSDLAKVAERTHLGPAGELRHPATLRGRAAAVWDRRLDPERHRARRLRWRDRRCARERRRPGGRAVLDPARHLRERLRGARG